MGINGVAMPATPRQGRVVARGVLAGGGVDVADRRHAGADGDTA